MASMLLLQNCKKIPTEIIEPVNQEASALRGNHHKEVDIKLIADSLVSPLGVVTSNDETKRLFIIDQIGKIWIIDKNGNRLMTPYLDISSKIIPLNPNGDERGMLGVAFHPRYKQNGKFYVSMLLTLNDDWQRNQAFYNDHIISSLNPKT